jgi:hypothetical protein
MGASGEKLPTSTNCASVSGIGIWMSAVQPAHTKQKSKYCIFFMRIGTNKKTAAARIKLYFALYLLAHGLRPKSLTISAQHDNECSLSGDV